MNEKEAILMIAFSVFQESCFKNNHWESDKERPPVK